MASDIIQFPNERNKQIYHLRRGGLSIEDIAIQLEITTAEVVRGFRTYMIDMVSETSLKERDHIVAMELDRLDQLTQPFYAQATEGEKDGLDGYLKIAAHRMKLLRLDQPTPDELGKGTQIIVVTGNKEDYEAALIAGQQRQVAGLVGDDDEEEEAK